MGWWDIVAGRVSFLVVSQMNEEGQMFRPYGISDLGFWDTPDAAATGPG